MTSVPVPVHFDGHNINIITEDSPSMCKDRTKILSMFPKKKNRAKNKKMTNLRSGAKMTSQIAETASSVSSSYSMTPVDSNKEHSAEQSLDPQSNPRPSLHVATQSGADSTAAPSYKSKTMRDSPSMCLEDADDVQTRSSPDAVSAKTKGSGFNPNAKPFVMSIRPAVVPAATRAESQDLRQNPMATTTTTTTRHRKIEYQPPPRLQNQMRHCGQGLRGGAPSQQMNDAQMIAEGLNPGEFGSHDDDAMEDDDDEKCPMKGKERRSLFKTELCREWATSGWCYYNKRCSFAHGLHELRPVFRSKKWRTKRCRNWHTTGYCPYEHRCQFLHDQSPPRRVTDYAQNNERAMVAPQQSTIKPLYFHYQVDCERDTDDAAEAGAAPGIDNEDLRSQRDRSAASSAGTHSGSGSGRAEGLHTVDNDKLYKYANDAPSRDGPEHTASTTSKGKKRRSMKEAVITQFNPSAAVYPAQGTYDLNQVVHGMPPYPVYPGGIPPMALPMQAGQPLLATPGCTLAPPLRAMAASPGLHAASLLTAAATPNQPQEPTMYLNFTPTPSAQHEAAAIPNGDGGLHNNMAVIPNMTLHPDAIQTQLNVEASGSLTPPPVLDGKAYAAQARKFDSFGNVALSMYERALAAVAQQQLQDMNMSSYDPNNLSPSESDGIDDSALLDLLPPDEPDVIGPLPSDSNHSNERRKNHHDDDEKDLDEHGMSNMLRTHTAGSDRPSASPHSGKTLHSGAGHEDSDKDDDDVTVMSMAGVLPPPPPALHLQTSADSIVMGAVNAAFLANHSPAPIHGIHLPAAVSQHLVHCSPAAAHSYAQNYAAAQVRGVAPAPNPFALPPGYLDAAALPYTQQMGLRVQPPPTVMTPAAVRGDAVSMERRTQ